MGNSKSGCLVGDEDSVVQNSPKNSSHSNSNKSKDKHSDSSSKSLDKQDTLSKQSTIKPLIERNDTMKAIYPISKFSSNNALPGFNTTKTINIARINLPLNDKKSSILHSLSEFHNLPQSKLSTKKNLTLIGQSQKNLKRLSLDNKEMEVINKYEVVRMIGEGSHGKVSEVRLKETGELFALKIYKRNVKIHKEFDEVEEELNIMNQLNHPNIIKVTDYHQTNEYHYVFFEICQGVDLSQIIKQGPLIEANAAIVMKQLFQVADYLHCNNVLNRDIKTNNILIKSNKIGDFTICLIGFESAMITNYAKHSNTYSGSFDYRAPEIIKKKQFTPKCDMFSLGVVMYEILSGQLPFQSVFNKTQGEYERIEEHYNFEKRCWDNITDLAKNLIKRLLKKNPEERISAKEALNDPWILRYTEK